TVRVLRDSAGRRTVVGHDNKAVKGALTRALVAEQVTGPEALDGWVGPGGHGIEGVTEGRIELVSYT
ncbi:MAG TPA: hypothetical protein VIJ71_07865, partial [Mycobacteriales bacterium]